MIDVASVLAERYPTATVVLTWCCTRCCRGWTAPAGRRPTCTRCGQVAEQRDAQAAIPLGTAT